MLRRLSPRSRTLFTILLAAALPLVSEHVLGPLTFNHTNSMPLGFYWRTAVPISGPHRGDLVIACAPTAFARFGHEKGFLDVGRCDGASTLLKKVVAVVGDRVHLDARGVRVNGRFLLGSRPAPVDGGGDVMPHVPYGDYVLSARDVWLASPKSKSFDSRYFGPVSSVIAIARPVLVEGTGLPENR